MKTALDWGVTPQCIIEFEASVTDAEVSEWVAKTQQVFFLKRLGYYSDFGRSGQSSWIDTGDPIEKIGRMISPDPVSKREFLISRLMGEDYRARKIGLNPAKWGKPAPVYR